VPGRLARGGSGFLGFILAFRLRLALDGCIRSLGREAGLFAAIPAVIAYNIYLHRIRDFALRMDNFASEFVAKIETLYS